MTNYNSRKRALPTDEAESPPKKAKVAFYLDDETPVRTIEVTDIGDEITEASYLRGYFEHAAGRISNIWMVKSKAEANNVPMLKAFITFVLPEDAAHAISQPELFKFTVKQAESIYQPKRDSNSFTIEGLNDCCLLKIASYLELSDIINLGKSTTRLQSFTDLIYNRKTHFSFGANTGDSSITESNVESALEAMGNHIERIEWHNLNANNLTHLLKHCTGVTELKLMNPAHVLHHPIFKANRQFFRNLESLHIYRSSVFDGPLKEMTPFSRLTSLELNNCHNIHGKLFSTWKDCRLRILKLIDCRIVTSGTLFNFIGTLQLVKFYFDGQIALQDVMGLPTNCLAELEELQLNLQSLSEAEIQQIRFGHLSRLRHLDINLSNHNRNCTSVHFFGTLNGIPKLVSLTIRGIVATVDTLNSMGLLETIRKLRFRNSRLTNEFLESLHHRVPHITELELFNCNNGQYPFRYPYYYSNDYDQNTVGNWNESICKMIKALPALKHIRCNHIDYGLLNKILQVQLSLKRAQIEVGISGRFDVRMKELADRNSEHIKLTVLPLGQ